MDARNLAIVFGPTLLQPAQDKNMVNMVKDMNDQCQIVESIIANVGSLWKEWMDGWMGRWMNERIDWPSHNFYFL